MPQLSPHAIELLRKGRRLAEFLPDYALLGVDPGCLFRSTKDAYRDTLDLPEDVVDCLLKHLEKAKSDAS
jgi:hypothetical protein